MKSNNQLVEYLNAIDFSLVDNEDVLGNIYKEVTPHLPGLSKDPFVATSLEKLINLSNSSHLLKVLNIFSLEDKGVVHRKLGSRLLECLYKRLFECFYEKKESFSLSEAFEFLNVRECIDCRNGTFVLREALMLLSGKKVKGLEIRKYSTGGRDGLDCGGLDRAALDRDGVAVDCGGRDGVDRAAVNSAGVDRDGVDRDGVNSAGVDRAGLAPLPNSKYSKMKIQQIKGIFADCLPLFDSNDQFNTLGLFLQISRSQSLIQKLISRDCSYENILKRGFLYEIIPTISNKKNLALIYERTKNHLMELGLLEKSSYFVKSFILNCQFCDEIYKMLDFDEFSIESNVILSLLVSLQKSMNYSLVDNLIKNFYFKDVNIKNKNPVKIFNTNRKNVMNLNDRMNSDDKENGRFSLFNAFLFQKYGSFDSKFISVVTNFMSFPEIHSYGVNEDFLCGFKKEWMRSKNGIGLVIGFAEGSCDLKRKMAFFDKFIDLFWDCYKWQEGKKFIKLLCGLTTGHARKKAFEMQKKLAVSRAGG